MTPSEPGNVVTDVLNPAKLINQGTLERDCRVGVARCQGIACGPPAMASCPPQCLGAWSGARLLAVVPAHRRSIGIPTSLCLGGPPPFLSMAWQVDQQESGTDGQWSCLAFIYTLGSFCVSILYVSLFR